MKLLLNLLLAVIAILLITGCPAEPPLPEVTTLYTAGYVYSSNIKIARVWTDGIPEDLTDGTYDAAANSVYVSGTDVYVSGYETKDTDNDGSVQEARYWKNGTEVILGGGTTSSDAYSIFVDGSDVYVSGYEMEDTNNEGSVDIHQARYWKNGTSVLLGTGNSDAAANSIFVSSTYIYIAGYENGDPDGNGSTYDIAKYWKIDKDTGNLIQEVILNSDQNQSAIATSIFVDGSDVYISGYEFADPDGDGYNYETAKLWKVDSTGTKTIDLVLSKSGNESHGKGIFVSGSEIYIAGYENEDTDSDGSADTNVAKFWTIDSSGIVTKTTNLSDGTSYTIANSIFVDGGDIHIVGTTVSFNSTTRTMEYSAQYWKNGTENDLNKQAASRMVDATDDGSEGMKSIFVVTE